ncbi:MAG: hypothetical protein LBH75_02170, partial [Treponema sp.]|nr:hypothetical protein [Treponema sp.]
MKVGSRAVQTKSITISVTVTANAATAALNSAGFTGVLFSVETANASINRGRIKCAPTAAGTVVQILWRLGWALGFEDCKYKQGRGYYYDGGFGGDLK